MNEPEVGDVARPRLVTEREAGSPVPVVADSDDAETKEIAWIAHLYYNKRRSQAWIARELGKSQGEISKSLGVAKQRRIVVLNAAVAVLETEKLAELLKQRFTHLQEVLLVPTINPSEEDAPSILEELGLLAAKYFIRRMEGGARIGVSCGTAVRSFVTAMAMKIAPEKLKSGCRVYPLNAVAGEEIVTINPTTMVASLVAALPDARGTPFQLVPGETQPRLENETAHLDSYVIGIGAIDYEGRKRQAGRTMKSHEFNSLIWNTGVVEALRELGAIGECIYQPFRYDPQNVDEQCQSLIHDPKLAALAKKMAFLPMKVLRGHVLNHSADVIGIAAGRHKLPAIHAALDGKLFNVLVSDSTTVTEILGLESLNLDDATEGAKALRR